ncbi:hypothetical protein BVG16_07005 [Paenibacillus selenitireducens]|uniref:Glycosyl transferase family 1 domain-containing protein n=1 Tax=Paenibacillus selenitireducens TaxID=1324314 RepID=A0A1T2XKS1_9BACL|nr:glycosyltransferase [Paenibacillus selenitireducens]OPA80470.1 hypothetical protein BVG16_07005 [Paenibacillus selenitireducens]
MVKVYLSDNSLSGHHKSYLDALVKIECTDNISEQITFEQTKGRLIYHTERLKYINNAIRKAQIDEYRGLKIVHFLYLDNLYTSLFSSAFFKSDKIRLIGTLHHIPQKKVKLFMLKIFAKKLDKIVVHSEYSKQELNNSGINNVEFINYPSFYDYSKCSSKETIRNEFGIDQQQIVLTAIGGTRFDKGLDILLDSVALLEPNERKRILLNIVGKEEIFKKGYILEKCSENGIDSRVKLEYLSDEDFMKNIKISDAIVLPYRKVFSGNSGPMTEAIVNNIPIISPEEGNLGYITSKLSLGVTFESENVKSLSKTIKKVINEGFDLGVNHTDEFHVMKFTEKYKTIYFSLTL